MKRQERQKMLLGKLNKLSSELVTDPDKLKAFADRWRGGFRQYSFHNLMLIWCQKSGATLCAGFKQWNRHKRYVNKGETAIWILAPAIFPVKKEKVNQETGETEETESKVIKYFLSVPVFDISQTNGQDLLIGNTEIKDNGDLRLSTVSSCFDYPVKITNGLSDGSTDGKSIRISKRKKEAQMVACYFHELAHILCEHAEKRGEGLSRNVRELEAESVSYLVCSCLGIENQGSKLYLGSWKANGEKIEQSSLKILKTAEKILKQVKPEFFKPSCVVAC